MKKNTQLCFQAEITKPKDEELTRREEARKRYTINFYQTKIIMLALEKIKRIVQIKNFDLHEKDVHINYN